jgi:ribonuclease HII
MLKPFYQKEVPEAGCDEAGRGCLAGPVFAAAVILPLDFHHPLLNDSKQVREKERSMLREVIMRESISWAVSEVDHGEIDRINILQASLKAMHQALDRLVTRPGFILVDGNRFSPYPFTPHLTVVKGDSEYASIAAASILAKTFRDDHMLNLHKIFPHYNWQHNKGYPTATHRQAIREFGLSPFHRSSFQCLPGSG